MTTLDYYHQTLTQIDHHLRSIGESRPILGLFGIEVVFLTCFTSIVLGTAARSTFIRTIGLVLLAATTYAIERLVVPLCLSNGRPHWAATVASLLWVQYLSASELIIVSRIDASQLPFAPRGSKTKLTKSGNKSLVASIRSAIGLLWNMRRVGTPWQVRNVPSVQAQLSTSRFMFILQRLVATVLAYLFVDVVVSLPPAEAAMIAPEKAALFKGVTGLDVGDIIFRTIMTASYWITTGVLNLFMTNTGAIVSVALGLSQPKDCPPLYGSFADAYTVRRFWGISWHQMFRAFLTGHADLLLDPVLPRRSFLGKYTRLLVAFVISGLIHYHGDALMGVSATENGAMVFFCLHAAGIMVEDLIGPLLSKFLPKNRRLRRTLGYMWVCAFFVWTTPVYMYPGNRLGLKASALLPVRVFGPAIERALPKA